MEYHYPHQHTAPRIAPPGTRVWYTVSSLVFFQSLQIAQLIWIKGEMKIKKSGSAHLDFDTRGASYVGTTRRFKKKINSTVKNQFSGVKI